MVMLPFVAAMVCGLLRVGQPPAKPPVAPPRQQMPPTTVASNALGFVIQRGTEQGIEIAEEGRGWVIRDGEFKIQNERLPGRTPLDPKLQINRFAVTDDTVLVKVDVSPSARADSFVKALTSADRAKPPTLVDTKGRKYEAVGFVYQDERLTHLRYTKGQPLKGLGEPGVPSVSLSTPGRHLALLFTVSLGAEVKEFRVGDAVLETYSPALKCDQRQK